MTPEKRLNQIEPFIAELSAQMDRVAAQNKQLISTAVQHTDDIQFLLHEVGDLKLGQLKLEQQIGGLDQRMDGLDQRMDGLDQRMGGLDQRMGGLEQQIGGLDQRIDGLEQGQVAIDAKVDLILQLLQPGKQNGKP